MRVLLSLLFVVSSCFALRIQKCPGGSARATECVLKCCVTARVGVTPTVSFERDRFPHNENRSSYERLEVLYSNPRCSLVDGATGLYECSTHVHKCQVGSYRCIVSQYGESVKETVKNIDSSFGDIGIPTCSPTCSPPVISNINTQQLDQGGISVQWSYRRNGTYEYCDGSRQFSLHFEAYHDGLAQRIAKNSTWFNVTKRRQSTYDLQDLNPAFYYMFEVRSKSGNPSTNGSSDCIPPPKSEWATPVKSKLFYYHLQSPVSMVTPDRTFDITEGGEVNIVCEANGEPPPILTYYKIGDNLSERETLHFSAIKPDDAGLYGCDARNTYFDHESGRLRESSRTSLISIEVYSRNRTCFTYTGSHCSEFLHSSWTVFSDSSGPETSQQAGNFLDRVKMSNFSDECSLFVKSVLCHSLLPYCDRFNSRPYPLKICPKTCEEMRSKCLGELDPNSELYEQLLSSCGDRRKGPGDKPGCIYVDSENPLRDGPSTDISYEEETRLCIVGNGRNYRGKERRTENRHFCQAWSTTWPHTHVLTDLMGAELAAAGPYCRNPGGLGERPWCFIGNVTVRKRWEYCNIPPCETCTPYTGTYCSPLGYTNETSVVLYRNVKESVDLLEAEILGRLYGIRDLITPGCQQAVRQLVCYGAMPTCNGNATMKMCQDHCTLQYDLKLCSSAVQTELETLGYLNLGEKCEDPPSQDLAQCMPEVVRLSIEKGSARPNLCYNEDDLGQSYIGQESTTENNRPCLHWDSVGGAALSSSNFPELEGAENFCRNPGQLGRRPWCYTSAAGDWGYCNISLCGGAVEEVVPLMSSDEGGWSSPTIIVVVTIVSVGGIVAVIVIGVFIAKKWNSRYKITSTDPEEVRRESTNRLYVRQSFLPSSVLQMMKFFTTIEKSRIQYVKQLGQGNFGVVFQGKCDQLEEGEEQTMVAVKTLKQESSQEAVMDFVREAKLLHTFDHPNIVHFYGVCMEDMPYYMVFEYMDQGDLCQFLRMHGSSAQRRYNPPMFRDRTPSTISTESATLGVTQLLDFCKQIASGMAYLESKKHIHRDLACRNCLIKTGMIVKIADFGMSQNLYSRDYYRVQGQAVLPVRWMPPESIIYGTFSTLGDVWSFGVVVWEIFSFALQPYWGCSNDAVTDMIRHGKLLSKPEACPDKVYALVKDGCWQMDERERMTFGELHAALSNFRLSDSDVSDISISIDETDTVFDDGNDDNKED